MDYNLKLSWFDEPAGIDVPTDSACVDREWCAPSVYSEIVGVDFGKQGMCTYAVHSSKAHRAPLNKETEWFLSLPPGTLVVGEWAHLAVPQTEKSLAQFFSAATLRWLYDELKNRGVTLLLYPHYHSGPRAREWAAERFPEIVGREKSDDFNDAKALALYVKYCNGVSLAKPPANFDRCQKRDYGRAVIDEANRVLNAERVRGYIGSKFPHVVELGRAIRTRCGGKFIDHMRAVSIAALIATEIDGEPFYFTRNGHQPGAHFWKKYVLRFTPFHHRGGIARSNLLKHGFPSFFVNHARRNGVSVKDGKQRQKFGTFDERQDAARRKCFKSVREQVIRAYRVGADEAVKAGFRPYEVAIYRQLER